MHWPARRRRPAIQPDASAASERADEDSRCREADGQALDAQAPSPPAMEQTESVDCPQSILPSRRACRDADPLV